MNKHREAVERASFLVGGAVRDICLGKSPKDRDFVVVGCTPEQMKKAGFIKVGKDFPVFLHPITREEYALARKERSTGPGYNDFETDFSPDVTLVEDLSRRDLTINSMAMDKAGHLIDPFGGLEDLKSRVIKMTSDAFKEDPLRVFRAARFATKYNFLLSRELINTARNMDLTHLAGERVFLELTKVFEEDINPVAYFKNLDDLHALDYWYSELKALQGQTQPEKWHPEGDAYVHTLQCLNFVYKTNIQRSHKIYAFKEFVAALCHDYGKGLTKPEDLPHHHGHEQAGVPLVETFCDRLKMPKKLKGFCVLVCEEHGNVHNFDKLSPQKILKMYYRLGKQKAKTYRHSFPLVSFIDKNGRGTASNPYYYEDTKLMFTFNALDGVYLTAEEREGVKHEHLSNKLHAKRISKAREIQKAMK